MSDKHAGTTISARAFSQSVFILLALMLAAGILTRVLPAGSFSRVEEAGRQVIVPGSYQPTPRPDYAPWRWLTAPLEVLGGPDALVLITIAVFILLVGGGFAVLDDSGILQAALGRIVRAFGARKYALLWVLTFFFMAMGAFFGLFEEVVPLVPLMVALSYSLGWDLLVGLGMSILATNMGFSAAISNPFSIGVAQKLAGLPLFSGALFRLPFFLIVYVLVAVFLTRYARRIERDPQRSLVYGEDQEQRGRFGTSDFAGGAPVRRGAVLWFGMGVGVIVLVLVLGPIVPGLSDYSLPLVGVLFFAAGLGAGLLSGREPRRVWAALGQGMLGLAPGIPLILMAGSVKFIITQGGVMDTILNAAAQALQGATPLSAALLVYALALVIEIFIGSAGAKAVLLMPLLLPLADLVGVTRQVAVTAYCFGDGFSNLAYPTNPVLLIVLGLANLRYSRWMRWTAPLWAVVLPVTLVFLWLAVVLKLGPF